jgi:formamidopyrimidine-DNA glycosylase
LLQVRHIARMPELPEVETTVRGLAKVLDGRRIKSVEARRADLRRAFPKDLGQRLTGAKVVGLGRRAKYGLIHTDRKDTMIFHLGMSGSWRINRANLEIHDHLLLETDEGTRLALNDPRRFGSVDLIPTGELDAWPAFKALGPEPMDLDARDLQRWLAGRTAPIKLLLLDQGIVAGLGNIYVCEALFRAHLSPRRLAATLATRKAEPTDHARRLVSAIHAVLNQAISAGGSSLRDHRQTSGELGYFQHSFQVYGREGEKCQTAGCSGIVRRFTQNGRSTFWCPKCQK